MSRSIYIDGYDFTNDVSSIPVQDKTTPEWGQVEQQIMNEVVKFTVPRSLGSFFDNGRDINKIRVQIYESNILEFDGAISEIDYTQTELQITCKSFSTILFNSTLNADESDYIIENAYPADILKEVLRLSTVKMQETFPFVRFTLDENYYNKALDIQKQLGFVFNVYARETNFSQLINKLMEVTCGIMYYEAGVYYYEMYSDDTMAAVVLNDDDFVNFPQIDNPESFSIGYNGTNIKFNVNLALLDENTQPSKTIDMARNDSDFEVSTDSIIVAEYIAGLYDSIGYGRRVQLNTSVDKRLQNIIRKNSYVRYNDVTYRVLSLNTSSDVELNIRAEAIRSQV